MKKTMIRLILDRSGSMGGLEKDVIGGVNNFLTEQKAIEGEAIFAATRFDTVIETFRPLKNLREVADLHGGEFQPRGSTALLDAIGKTILEMDKDWIAYAPEQAIVVIYTDGQENASREFTRDKIKQMIEARQEGGKWSFLFLAANLDAVAEASTLGIWGKGVTNMKSSPESMTASYNSVSSTVGAMRSVGNHQYFADASIASLADSYEVEEKKEEGKTKKSK